MSTSKATNYNLQTVLNLCFKIEKMLDAYDIGDMKIPDLDMSDVTTLENAMNKLKSDPAFTGLDSWEYVHENFDNFVKYAKRAIQKKFVADTHPSDLEFLDANIRALSKELISFHYAPEKSIRSKQVLRDEIYKALVKAVASSNDAKKLSVKSRFSVQDVAREVHPFGPYIDGVVKKAETVIENFEADDPNGIAQDVYNRVQAAKRQYEQAAALFKNLDDALNAALKPSYGN